MALRGFLTWLALVAAAQAATATGTLPIRLHRDYLVIADCDVPGGGKVNALIDTGTTRTILDRRIADRLRLRTEPGQTIALNRPMPARVGRLPELRVGPIRVLNLPVFVLDLEEMSGTLGIHLDMLVGMDVLRGASFTLDYHRRQIVFGVHTREDAVALDPRLPYLVLVGRLGSTPLRLQVDTGFDGLLLYRDRVPSGTLPPPRPMQTPRSREMRSMAGPAAETEVEVGDLWIDGLRLAGARALVLDRAPEDAQFDGVIGPRGIPVSSITFDFERSAAQMRR
ncbi:MAG TPA: retropepsin-like aspartic protease [Terriglobales bacterium]|nr:retropepsin-like aspartic protease [Terriglobales bacterium]